jgi:hypothetical protein
MRGVVRVAVVGLLVAVTAGCGARVGHIDSVSVPAVSIPATLIPATSAAAATSAPATSAAAVTSPRASGASKPSAVIPAEFRGSFNTDKEACGTDSEGSMVADAHSLHYYEGGGPVTTVVRKGSVITITATWNAEGTTQTETFDLAISADGETVTDLTTDTVRYRCH